MNKLVMFFTEIFMAVITINGGNIGAKLAQIDIHIVFNVVNFYFGSNHVG